MCVRNSCGCLPVGGWPCVQALLSIDNIVSGGWLTEGTWRHEIILCRAMCSPIGTWRVLTSSQIHLQPFRQLFLLAPICTPTVFPATLRFSGISVTLHALLSKTSITFILLLFEFTCPIKTPDWFQGLVYWAQWVMKFIISKHLITRSQMFKSTFFYQQHIAWLLLCAKNHY